MVILGLYLKNNNKKKKKKNGVIAFEVASFEYFETLNAKGLTFFIWIAPETKLVHIFVCSSGLCEEYDRTIIGFVSNICYRATYSF